MANRPFSEFAPFLWSIQENENARLKGLVVNGTDVPVGGAGLEFFGGTSPSMQAYNRDTSAYLVMNWTAAVHSFKAGAGATTYVQIGDLGLGCIAGTFAPPPYTLSTLPTASIHTNRLIVVTNATGGPKLCISNGTNWLRVSDDAIVS